MVSVREEFTISVASGCVEYLQVLCRKKTTVTQLEKASSLIKKAGWSGPGKGGRALFSHQPSTPNPRPSTRPETKLKRTLT